MSNEVPDISLKEMLMVPEGPPAGVWERALEAAFAAPQQEDGPDVALPAAAAAAGTEADMDVDTDADGDGDGENDPDADGGGAGPAFDFQPVPDPSFGGEEPEPDGLYFEGEVRGDGDDVPF